MIAENSYSTRVSAHDKAFFHQLRAEFERRKLPSHLLEGAEAPAQLRDTDGREYEFDTTVRGVQVLDKFVSTTCLQEIEADIWIEDDRDICLHIVPSKGELTFVEFDFVQQQVNNVFRHVFAPMEKGHGIHCVGRYWGHRTGDGHVKRITDSKWPGGDLFDLRVVGMMQRPLAVKCIVDVLRTLDRVIARHEPAY